MILTHFISPIYVDSFDYTDEYLPVKEMPSAAPCFLTYLDKEKPLNISKQWKGCLYGSEKVLKEIRAENDSPVDAVRLEYNKQISVLLSNLNSVKVTMFSAGIKSSDCCLLLLEDAYISCIVTTRLGNLDEILQNSLLKNKIKCGIDVLYIDDSIYGNPLSVNFGHPDEFQLRALVYYIRPYEVIGINNNEIPQYINDLCDEMW